MKLVLSKTIIRSNLAKGCFFVFHLCMLLFLFSCNHFLKDTNEKPIARVGTHYLYSSDIKKIAFTNEDSQQVVSKYIDNWIRELLLLQHAEKNILTKQAQIDERVEDYRRSLITYEYESQLIEQKLDTAVSDEEIQGYYNENKNDFELKDNIIKVNFIKVKKNTPNVDKVAKWYKSEDQKEIDTLRSYCQQFADNFYLEDNNWLLFDDVLKEIPIKMYDREAFLQNNRFIETSDSIFLYFVNIKGFMAKNSLSPLSFQKETIRNRLINKRKVSMIKTMRQDLYDEGMKNNVFEIYK
jgi:hypothetical protein